MPRLYPVARLDAQGQPIVDEGGRPVIDEMVRLWVPLIISQERYADLQLFFKSQGVKQSQWLNEQGMRVLENVFQHVDQNREALQEAAKSRGSVRQAKPGLTDEERRERERQAAERKAKQEQAAKERAERAEARRAAAADRAKERAEKEAARRAANEAKALARATPAQAPATNGQPESAVAPTGPAPAAPRRPAPRAAQPASG